MNSFKIPILILSLLACHQILAQKDSPVKTHPNDTLTAVKPSLSMIDSLTRQMKNDPAPPFTLVNLEGVSISLSDLKGKIVIIDFWATWCPPCKAAMPAFQIAVDQYKKREDIQFLFIDCGERVSDYSDSVKKFIKDNNYSFCVLLDEKDKDGHQIKVLNSYKVDGIPTKFIIDRNGNIRFKSVGYSGNPKTLVAEINSMITLVEKDRQ